MTAAENNTVQEVKDEKIQPSADQKAPGGEYVPRFAIIDSVRGVSSPAP